MVIYKNDILCKKNNDGTLLPICWINDKHEYLYIDDYGFRECGIGKYYLSRYKEQDVRSVTCYEMKDCILIWDFDNHLIDNNLYLIHNERVIWNMVECVGYTDTCVSVGRKSDEIFSFITFNGIHFTIKIQCAGVECVDKKVMK